MAQDWFDQATTRAPSPVPTQGRVIRDPYRAREEGRKDEDQELQRQAAARAAEQVAIQRAAEARQAATLPYDVRRAEAEAETAAAKARAATNEQKAAPDPELSRIRQSLQTDNVLNSINAARRQIGEGWSTGNFFGSDTFQGVPFVGQNSADLGASLSGIQGSVINDTLKELKALSPTGASGYGSLTEREAGRLAASVAALQQSQSEGELLRNLAAVERHYRNAQALLNGEDPRVPEVAQKYGIVGLEDEPPKGKEPPTTGGVTSEGRSEVDPALAGVNARVSDMIRRGRPAPEIRAYLNTVRPGMGDQATGIEDAIAYTRQRPDDPVMIDLEKVWKPAGGFSRAMGDIGMSPLGSAVIGAADTVTFGALDNMTNNPAMTRAVMGGLSEENPNSYFLGQVGGALVPGIGIESALGRVGLGALGRARGGDILYGAAYGAGSADDPAQSRVSNALLGGSAGFLGGAAGRRAAQGVGRLTAGVTDGAQVLLDRAGVSMTPGQILGGAAGRIEDRLAGLPFVGDAIGSARRQGLDDFNRAAFDDALAPINAQTGGRIAEAGAEAAHDATSHAYRAALDGVEVVADEQFGDQLLDAVNYLRNVPRVGGEVADSVGEIVNPTYFTPADTLTGTNMQPMVQELRGLRGGYATDPLGNRVGEGVRSVEDAILGMFERQAPDVLPAYRAADEAYRNTSVIDDALLAAMNSNSGVFTPAQLGNAAKANAKKFGGRRAAAEGNRPFYELQRAGQQVLPSQVPDSGTAGRIALPLLLGGAAGGGSYAMQDGEASERAGSALGTSAVIAALAAAPYSRPARDAVQRALLAERPETVRRIGETIYDWSPQIGWVARPAAVTQTASQ